MCPIIIPKTLYKVPMIIFGTNNFSVKTLSLSDLQIADDNHSITIELRQRFFHVFWIPFFPIGQSWVMRRAHDTNKYMVPAEWEAKINELGYQQSPPWYSFIGLILAGVAVLWAAFAGR